MNNQVAQRRAQELKRKRRNRHNRWLKLDHEQRMYRPVKQRRKQIAAALVKRKIELFHIEQATKRLEQKYGHTPETALEALAQKRERLEQV